MTLPNIEKPFKEPFLDHFVSFLQEAIVLSIISVIKTRLEVKRKEYLDSTEVEEQIKTILEPLIKRHEIQFKNLLKATHGKIARQTFVTYLQQATNLGIVIRREQGRSTYYSLNISPQEEKILHDLLEIAKSKLTFIPDEIKLA
jgi:DNA-binding transcriptional ArsR family regulator